MKIIYKNACTLLLSVLLFTACNTDRFTPKPMAMGEPNTITIVAEKDLLKGAFGDTLSALFEQPYLILPQVEPQYDLRYHDPQSVAADAFKRNLRTYIIPVLTNDTSNATARFVRSFINPGLLKHARRDTGLTNQVYKDLWARAQIVVLLFGRDAGQLSKRLKEQYPAIIKLIKLHDKKLVHLRAFSQGEDHRLMSLIDSMFGLEMKIPDGYFMAVKKKDILWMRKDYLDINMNIMIAQYPYRNPKQVSKEGMVQMFNDLGKLVTTDTPGDRVVIDDKNFPVILYTRTIDGHYAVEMRAIWNTVKDFFGGPALVLAIIDQKKGKVYYISGFVYSPNKKKRDLIELLYDILTGVHIK